MNVFKVCVRVECELCVEALLVWVQPTKDEVVVGFERQSFYSDEQSPCTRSDVLILQADDVIQAAVDEGWRHHYRASNGVICQKCNAK